MIVLTNSVGVRGLHVAAAILARGGGALDAIEAGIRAVEADPSVRSVGRGGLPNMAGVVECDAALMEGSTRMVGAVGALRGVGHPISVARAILECLPHVMLVGEGAGSFARERGFAQEELLADEARVTYEEWRSSLDDRGKEDLAAGRFTRLAPRRPSEETGTVICLVKDRSGHIAAGPSTSGWPCKYPVRLGDTPVVGAGIYADDRYGACGCTHTGEMTIRCSTARAVVLAMRHGASVREACADAATS